MYPTGDLACALTGNWTSGFLVHRLAFNPLSHASQGSMIFFWSNHLFVSEQVQMSHLSPPPTSFTYLLYSSYDSRAETIANNYCCHSNWWSQMHDYEYKIICFLSYLFIFYSFPSPFIPPMYSSTSTASPPPNITTLSPMFMSSFSFFPFCSFPPPPTFSRPVSLLSIYECQNHLYFKIWITKMSKICIHIVNGGYHRDSQPYCSQFYCLSLFGNSSIIIIFFLEY